MAGPGAWRRASKYGPVFRSSVMGEEVYVVGDFPSIEKLMLRGEFQLVTMKQSKTVAALLQLDSQRSRNKESHARQVTARSHNKSVWNT